MARRKIQTDPKLASRSLQKLLALLSEEGLNLCRARVIVLIGRRKVPVQVNPLLQYSAGSQAPGKYPKTGDNEVMKFAVFTLLIGSLGFAEEATKPACKAANRGQFWPAEANVSRDAVRQFFQSGELEVCSMVVWKYKWQHLSVNAHDLAKHTPPSTPEPRKTGDEGGR